MPASHRITVWELAWGKERKLFASKEIALASIRLSYNNLPDAKITELDNNAVLVEWDDNGGCCKMEWFTLTQLLKQDLIYDQPEHL